MLELAVLAENSVKIISNLQGEHGLSIYLKCDGLEVLFDTGASDLYLRNAAKLDINLSCIDWIVFSHHHYDHVGGLKYFQSENGKKVKILAQKYAFYPRVDYPNDLADRNITARYETVSVDSEPIFLSEDFIFLASIPRLNNFECKDGFHERKVLLSCEKLEDDFCPDDSALIYKSSGGIIVITGCSHSGICNIVHYAKQIAAKYWNISNVKSIIGGLHLINSKPEFLQNTINLLREYGVEQIFPCHCTDLAAKIALAKADFKVGDVNSGTIMKFL